MGGNRRNVGDFLKNVGDFLRNVGDFLKNMGDFLKNVGDFLRNVGDIFSPAFHPTSHPLFIILRSSKREGKINYRFINISALSRARVCAHISDFVLFAFTTFTLFIAISYNSDRYTAFCALLVSFFRKSSQERTREYVKKCPKIRNNSLCNNPLQRFL